MRDIFIKICGLRREVDILWAINQGANAVGFIVGTTHFSEDELDIDRAKQLIRLVPSSVLSVVVTHFKDTKLILPIASSLRPRAIQLQGDISIEEICFLKKKIPQTMIIKAVHVTDEDAIQLVKHYQEFVDFILLDSRTEDRLGGTGIIHDWKISAEIVKECTKPIILAGGLNPENVCRAIREVKPFGVDVNSGTKSHDGFKDLRKIREFIKNVRGCTENEDFT